MTDEKMTDENSRIAETISLSQGQMTVYRHIIYTSMVS